MTGRKKAMFTLGCGEDSGPKGLLVASFACLVVGFLAWGVFACRGWMVADMFWLLAAINAGTALRRSGDSPFDWAAGGGLVVVSGALIVLVTYANRPIPCGA
jgi:hypothetical protein